MFVLHIKLLCKRYGHDTIGQASALVTQQNITVITLSRGTGVICDNDLSAVFWVIITAGSRVQHSNTAIIAGNPLVGTHKVMH